MTSDIELKRASECTFRELLFAWNTGFVGYFVDMTLSLDALLARLSAEGISLDSSLIAFAEKEPVGFLLNGFRKRKEKNIAWNGGTGVVPSFRGKGIGKLLVNAALDIYAEQQVNWATLEAISDNVPAIELYKKCGYDIVDELTFLQTEKEIEKFTRSEKYEVRTVPPVKVGALGFYRETSPWQCQWQSVEGNNGDAFIAYDARNTVVGYALRKIMYDEQGKPALIALYQCEAAPDADEPEDVAGALLETAFTLGDGSCLRRTYNLRKSNDLVVSILKSTGFTLLIEQVQMVKTIS